MYVYTYILECIQIYVYTCSFVCIHINLRRHISRSAIYTHTHIYIYIYIYIYINSYLYVHVYIFTYCMKDCIKMQTHGTDKTTTYNITTPMRTTD